jgi:hypothetical protein
MAATHSAFLRLLLVFATYLMYLGIGKAQENSPGNLAKSISGFLADCEIAVAPLPVKEALWPVCLRTHTSDVNIPVRSAIIVGFVGGFAREDDLKHPEVNFAALLNKTYPSILHAEVFANHDGNRALERVLQLVDSNEDGVITATEKEKANVIIYGHSWGGSQTVALARALGHYGIPVELTIQLDSVRKPGQEDSTIPPNVKNAINFYQTRGPIHGRSMIRAADPGKTHILGNLQMTYEDREINCTNYPWFPRHFNKPHHEIENDPRVWDQVGSLIDSELLEPVEIAALPSN